MDQQPAQPNTTLRVLWGALVMSIFVYVLVGYMITSEASTEGAMDPESLQVIKLVFAAVSVTTAGLGLWLPKRMVSDSVLEGIAREHDTEAARLEALIPKVYTASLLRLALFESIAIFGFLLTFLSRELVMMLPFAAVAVLLNVATFPRMEAYSVRLQQLANRLR